MNLTTILKDMQSLLPLGKYRNKTNEETKNVWKIEKTPGF